MKWSIAFLCCRHVGGTVETVHFTQISSLDAAHDLVKLQRRSHAVPCGRKVLRVVQTFQISAAARRRGAPFQDSREKIRGLSSIVGSLVYVADDLAGLAILDVSDPAKPRLRGTLKTRGQAKAVVILGTKALVVDHMDGLALIDVSDAAKPVPAGTLFLDGYARDVALSGSVAYAVDSPTGFYVVDLSKPGPLDFAGSLQSANGQTVAVSGTIACVSRPRRIAPVRSMWSNPSALLFWPRR